MGGIQVRSLGTPDETRKFAGKGKLDLVQFGETSVGRATFEPGWRWSQNIKPIAGTKTCEASHLGYCLSGSMRIRMDDGEEQEVRAGDSFSIKPGHDAWVTSKEDCVMLDFSGFQHYAEEQAARPSIGAQAPAVH